MSQTAYQKAPQQEETPKEKTALTENTTLARRVLAAAIALSLLVIGPIKLRALRNSAVKDLKYNSSVTTEYNDDSVGYYVNRSMNAADNIVSRVRAGGETAEADKLDKLLTRMRETKDEKEFVSLYYEMYKQATTLYNMYLSDDSSARRLKDNLDSFSKTIETNDYWSVADKFNSARNDIPGRLMALIWGIKDVPSK